MLTQDSEEVPEACCRREPQALDGVLLNREECVLGRSLFIHTQVGPAPGAPEQSLPAKRGEAGMEMGLVGAAVGIWLGLRGG